MTVTETPLGTFDSSTQSWTPSAGFAAELLNDPTHLGYKQGNGAFFPAATIAGLLTSPQGTVANPLPQATIAKPFTYVDVLNLLSTASQANVRALPELPRILDDINAANRQAVSVWAGLLIAGNAPPITQAEHDAIINLMNATEPDPSWPSTVPGPSRLQSLFDVGSVELRLITTVTGTA